MANKVLILGFLLCLALSSNLFSGAVPISRSLKSFIADFPVQSLLSQDETLRTHGKFSVKKGRIDMETMDYSDPGANNDHDPKTPPSRV